MSQKTGLWDEGECDHCSSPSESLELKGLFFPLSSAEPAAPWSWKMSLPECLSGTPLETLERVVCSSVASTLRVYAGAGTEVGEPLLASPQGSSLGTVFEMCVLESAPTSASCRTFSRIDRTLGKHMTSGPDFIFSTP